MKLIVSAVVIAGVGSAAYARPELLLSAAHMLVKEQNAKDRSDAPPNYVMVKVDRGPIESAVAASGTLAAVATVLVSSQVAGPMVKIHADYNQEVKKGDIIGEIQPATFQNHVDLAQAELGVAEANVAVQALLYEQVTSEFASQISIVEAAQARVGKEQVTTDEVKKDLERKRVLSRTGSVSAIEFSKAQASLDFALQNLKLVESEHKSKVSLTLAEQARMRSVYAQVTFAKAQVESKRATLQAALTNLEMTKIRSPTDGVVVGRNIEEGQQVSTTLQTQQTLFTVAQDLREMQIKILVDEADIGKIRDGQFVRFQVDAYPGREFAGRVKQVRMDAKPVQNVVTYEVVASAPNPERVLLPGMTASARIVIDSRVDTTKVPMAALRFTPIGAERPTSAHVWVLGEDQKPEAVSVRVGLSDRQMVEVVTPRPVDRVIVGISNAQPAPSLMKRIIGSL